MGGAPKEVTLGGAPKEVTLGGAPKEVPLGGKAAGRNPGRSTAINFLNTRPGFHPGYNSFKQRTT